MASSGSTKSELSPKVSYAGLGKQRHNNSAAVGIRLQSSLSAHTGTYFLACAERTGYSRTLLIFVRAERHPDFATPADSVLHRFRIVRYLIILDA